MIVVYHSSVWLCLFIFMEQGPTLVHQSSPPLEVGTGALAGGLVFLTTNNTMVMAHQGASVTLSCRITKPPNSGMVTWTRQLEHEKSLQVLSIGDQTHISDPRFLIAKKPLDNDWQLRILSVSYYDSGQYLCQATTHPPQHIAARLVVVDAYAEIQVDGGERVQDPAYTSPREIFVKRGSQLKLRCELKKATEKPGYIFWYHNNAMVNYSPDSSTLVTNYREGWGSMIIINSASSSDKGNYTCSPQNMVPDSVMVTIMDSEGKSAAVYKDLIVSGVNDHQDVRQSLIMELLVITSASFFLA